MADFRDFDVEIQDESGRNTEHYNGAITTAGSPVTIATSSGNSIKYAYIYNPAKGLNANDPGDLIYISWDGGSHYTVIPRGGYIMWPGKGSGSNNHQITLDTNENGTKYEVMLIGEE